MRSQSADVCTEGAPAILVRAMRSAEKLHGECAAMLFLAAYIFVLRVPSEGFPMCRAGVGPLASTAQSSLYLEGEEVRIPWILCVACVSWWGVQVVLRLARRKNRPQGSVLRRACWCRQCVDTCPRHVLWPYFQKLAVGQAPFAGLSPSSANDLLRQCLAAGRVPKAAAFRCHDLRRGHCKDLQQAGATLRAILEAGEWTSPRYLEYLDLEELERDIVIDAHLVESDEE